MSTAEPGLRPHLLLLLRSLAREAVECCNQREGQEAFEHFEAEQMEVLQKEEQQRQQQQQQKEEDEQEQEEENRNEISQQNRTPGFSKQQKDQNACTSSSTAAVSPLSKSICQGQQELSAKAAFRLEKLRAEKVVQLRNDIEKIVRDAIPNTTTTTIEHNVFRKTINSLLPSWILASINFEWKRFISCSDDHQRNYYRTRTWVSPLYDAGEELLFTAQAPEAVRAELSAQAKAVEMDLRRGIVDSTLAFDAQQAHQATKEGDEIVQQHRVIMEEKELEHDMKAYKENQQQDQQQQWQLLKVPTSWKECQATDEEMTCRVVSAPFEEVNKFFLGSSSSSSSSSAESESSAEVTNDNNNNNNNNNNSIIQKKNNNNNENSSSSSSSTRRYLLSELRLVSPKPFYDDPLIPALEEEPAGRLGNSQIFSKLKFVFKIDDEEKIAQVLRKICDAANKAKGEIYRESTKAQEQEEEEEEEEDDEEKEEGEQEQERQEQRRRTTARSDISVKMTDDKSCCVIHPQPQQQQEEQTSSITMTAYHFVKLRLLYLIAVSRNRGTTKNYHSYHRRREAEQLHDVLFSKSKNESREEEEEEEEENQPQQANEEAIFSRSAETLMTMMTVAVGGNEGSSNNISASASAVVDDGDDFSNFLYRVASVLTRYQSLDGGTSAASYSNMHAAIHPAFATSISRRCGCEQTQQQNQKKEQNQNANNNNDHDDNEKKNNFHFGVSMECFANPFNSSVSRFGSLFQDTDKYFGSSGLFWYLNFHYHHPFEKNVCYELNPPFESNVVRRMTSKLHEFLNGKRQEQYDAQQQQQEQQQQEQEQEENNMMTEYDFLIVLPVPRKGDGEGKKYLDAFRQLKESTFCICEKTLQGFEAAYVKGNQQAIASGSASFSQQREQEQQREEQETRYQNQNQNQKRPTTTQQQQPRGEEKEFSRQYHLGTLRLPGETSVMLLSTTMETHLKEKKIAEFERCVSAWVENSVSSSSFSSSSESGAGKKQQQQSQTIRRDRDM